MHRIIELALKQAQAAEVFSLSEEEIPVEFEANRLKHIQAKQSSVVALRVIKDGHVGYSVTSDLDDIENLVKMAIETAQFGMQVKYDLPPPQKYLAVKTYDAEVEKITIDQMVQLSQQMIDAVLNFNPEVLCDAGASRQTGTIEIINSNGLEASCKSSLFSLGIGGNLIRGTDMLFVGDGLSSSHPINNIKPITNNVLRQLEWSQHQATITSNTLPVIFTPHGVENSLIAPWPVLSTAKWYWKELLRSRASWENSCLTPLSTSTTMQPWITKQPAPRLMMKG